MTSNPAQPHQRPMQRQKIGLLGGTFDPPHAGHLALASHFSQLLELDALWLIPAGQPWQKSSTITPAPQRLAMTELAAQALLGNFADLGLKTQVHVSTVELQRQGPSYAIDTVRAVRHQVGEAASITWLMGCDQLQRLDTWHAWHDLFAVVHLGVATRPGYRADSLPPAVQIEVAPRLSAPALLQSHPYGKICLDMNLAVDLSSTVLRQRIQRQQSCAGKIPATILHYIAQQHLYA